MIALVSSHCISIINPPAGPGRQGERVESTCERFFTVGGLGRTRAIDPAGGVDVIPEDEGNRMITESEVVPIGCGVVLEEDSPNEKSSRRASSKE